MHQGYLEINGVRTKITTFGRWVEENSKNCEDIVILIPGNPGVVGFYDEFAKTIHKNLRFPVWCIGHAGHNLPKQKLNPLPKLEGNEVLYGLKGQIEHKIDFFEKYIPKNAKIHLIGHSIGAYMILELLEHPSIKDKIADVHLLFPTFEEMALSSNGKFLTRFVKHIVWLIIWLSWIFVQLPTIIQTILLYGYMTIVGIPANQHHDNIKELINPSVLKRVFFLAFQEMEQVKDRNNDIIRRNISKLKFYYGENDGWTPPQFREQLKVDIPNTDIEISNYNHAFVLKRSVEVGDIVSVSILADAI
nr:lipid droplet-associated hydrolase [Leptinotarsa decemlineata]